MGTHDDRIFALSPDDQNFITRLLLREPPLFVEPEREKRLTRDGLVTRRYGQLVVTDEARRLLGIS
ncbi:MAG TPA: hypothetical protein VJM11_12485 [Nevskiaceae bacterium]|nr:hypothetical protein [Nevskiaceae bacterium]